MLAYVTKILNWWSDASLNRHLIPAERCRSLNYMTDVALELDGGSGHKKPPRKGRKILQATNGTILLFNILAYYVVICFQLFLFVSIICFERIRNML